MLLTLGSAPIKAGIMAQRFDSFGQTLIQLPLLAQVAIMVLVLMVVAGVGAFVLVRTIDVVHGRIMSVIGSRMAARGEKKSSKSKVG